MFDGMSYAEKGSGKRREVEVNITNGLLRIYMIRVINHVVGANRIFKFC